MSVAAASAQGTGHRAHPNPATLPLPAPQAMQKCVIQLCSSFLGPQTQTPHTVSMSVYNKLVDVSKPGDRLVVTGIFRSMAVCVNPSQRTLKSLFHTFIDVVHIKIGTDDRLRPDKSTRQAGGDRIPGVSGVGGGIDMDDNEENPVERQQRTSF